MIDAGDQCLELVRAHDKDRFLSALFAPEAAIPHLMALYAFNSEIVKIRSSVSEPQIGLIRLQWWRDTLNSLEPGAAVGHPVAAALASAAAAGRLPADALQDLVTAHEFDLYDDPVQDLDELETYLGQTSSVLMQLAAMILDRDRAAEAADAAGLAGVAFGLALILNDVDQRARFLPPDMDLAAAIAHARHRLLEARTRMKSLPPSLLPAFLPAALTDLYLRRVERRPDNPGVPSQFRRQFHLWWKARQETI